MTGSNGHQQVSYATDAPASGEQDDEIAMDELVRVGLVGLGRMGRFHAANLAGRIPGARLVRVADAAENMARENAARLGGVEWSTRYEDLLEDPDVEMIEAAAAAGKQEKISAGHIGEVYLFRTTLRDMRSPGFDYIRGSGGFFADVTVHDFDTARWLVGEISEVTAAGAALSDPGFEEVGDIDNAVITLRFASGALGVGDGALRTRCARRSPGPVGPTTPQPPSSPGPPSAPTGRGEPSVSKERPWTARSSTRRPIRALMQSIKAGAGV